ncbi:uncharacterized protein A4U43_C05F33190 [Asparagus officinalis]|uniref:Protein kinase domain-containing protein n=1 Tax=Asparagus officinalis TaxID=4686 RepID=A0A5P1EYY3_ASPOF|nr:uncharacterized protein LOC109842571 [Asparagus officinalis]ONK70387.1 uncharacterized protein A4U43_C05F33190 [Asparagus officinalis]
MASDPQRVKLLCSFGGKISPRFGRDRDLYAKLSQVLNGPISSVKYQLPGEDLDALISISSQEDLDNMMEEFDRISEMATDGSARMRVFLSSAADESEMVDTGQSYIDAVNGIGLKRKDSLVSASSSEGMSPSISSPTYGSTSQDLSRLGFGREEALVYDRAEPQQVQFFNPSYNVVNFPGGQHYGHPVCVNAASMVSIGGNLNAVQGKMEPLIVVGDRMGVVEGNLRPNQGKVEAFVEENLYRFDQGSNNGNSSSSSNHNNSKGFYHQPLSQLPPLHPTHIQQPPNMYAPPLRQYPHQMLRLNDCQMCQKALPHAHSDTLINDHVNGSGNGSGSSGIHDARPVLQSHHSEDPTRLLASLRPENTVEHRVETGTVAASQFYRHHENERIIHPNMEALDHAKGLHPTGIVGGADPNRLQAPPRVVNGSGADSDPKTETPQTGRQFAAIGCAQEGLHPHEQERLLHPNAEAPDSAKVSHPHNAGSGALADSTVESKVENMPTSSQFVAYGFTQIPKIPQPHDHERLLVNPNAPAVIGLPVGTHASYVWATDPSYSHFTDPFQSMSQNVAPPPNLSKQDDGTKQNASILKNGNINAAEPPSRVSLPEISHDNVRPINGMMESLHVSTFEPSPITEHSRATATVNRCVPLLKPENSTSMAENNHTFKPQVGGNAVFLGNSYIMSGICPDGNSSGPKNQLQTPSIDLKPAHPPVTADNTQAFRSQAGGNAVYLGNSFIAAGIVPEGSSIRPISQMPPSSFGFTHLRPLQPSETSQARLVMTNHGPLFSYNQEIRGRPEVLNEQLHLMPSYSCSITPAYNNINVINTVGIGHQNSEGSLFQPNNVPNNVASPPNGTASCQYSTSGGSNGHAEQSQGPIPSGSLFCNQDPQKIVGNMEVVPPRINKVPSKEFVAPKDACTESHLVNSKGSDEAVLAEEGGFHHLQNPTNKDLRMEPVQFVQGEDHNKQEVQGLADQVIASVIQPSLHSAPLIFPPERMESDLLPNGETGFVETNSLIQCVTAVPDPKTEVVMSKQADKMNFGFPFTDDMGHLQIIKNGDLEELRELGSGTFGTVYHGKWRGSDVAIKRINERCFAGKPSEEERMRADFWNEACKLADLHHPNVVAFYGVVLDGPGGSFATVTEFMVNGSLRRALQKNDKSLDKRKRLLIAMDVAFGMEYLHGRNIIHFDLKSDNLLVNLRDPQRPICKVADLGLSKVKCQTLISGGVRGTLPWMAPELLDGGSTLVSDKVDVFSFGIVMWELLTGEEPYADLHYGAIIGGIVSNTLRPPVPESCDPEWRSLMEQCWSAEPAERPNFTEIASRLRSIAASLPQN